MPKAYTKVRHWQSPKARERAAGDAAMVIWRLDKWPLRCHRSFTNTTLQYLIDEAGQKTAVVLSIADYEKVLEDLDDLSAIVGRRNEPTIPHNQFKAELKRDGVF
jgi:hypothetical protein